MNQHACHNKSSSRPASIWQRLVQFMRRWSGDDAYERYLAEHQDHHHQLLTRREFYRQYFNRRGNGGRCC